MTVELTSDCSRCAALCCIALDLSREDGFAIDKPAGVACPHLTVNSRCGIHANRRERGFAGCERYECFGAGQRVTQELFGGRSWRDEPELAAPMMEAFARMRGVHDALVLISQGRKLALAAKEGASLDTIGRRLDPREGWTLESLERAPVGAWTREIVAILRAAHERGVSTI